VIAEQDTPGSDQLSWWP